MQKSVRSHLKELYYSRPCQPVTLISGGNLVKNRWIFPLSLWLYFTTSFGKTFFFLNLSTRREHVVEKLQNLLCIFMLWASLKAVGGSARLGRLSSPEASAVCPSASWIEDHAGGPSISHEIRCFSCPRCRSPVLLEADATFLEHAKPVGWWPPISCCFSLCAEPDGVSWFLYSQITSWSMRHL